VCGIAGKISFKRPEVTGPDVALMLQMLRRRGPDSEGVANWPGVCLGHRRLAILDLSPAGQQPMLSDDGQIGLVFNGCIYNFVELRQELESCGRRFHSNCDTEVLLQGYEEWGIDKLVSRLRGMFAFGIWDARSRSLILVRDRLGVKPLVYFAGDGEIAFASTITALNASGHGDEIDPYAVLDLLEFGFITEQRAIYKGISKLPPATIAEWCDGHLTQRRYWSLESDSEPLKISFEEAIEETERLIVESVGLRLVSDVPIGALLSGGVDSTLVCWAMHKLNADITAFTVRAPSDPADESADASRTASLLSIPHQIVDMPEVSVSLDELLDAYCEPFPCSSALPMLWVSKAVKEFATVLLTGDGGDDVFLGYPLFQYAWLAQRFACALPDSLAPVVASARSLLPARGPFRRASNFLGYATDGLGAFSRVHDGLPYFEQHELLGEKLMGLQLPQRQLAASLQSARQLVSDVEEYHRGLTFLSEFMPKVDRATMYYSIESRAPLLDQHLWEFAAGLPPEIRLHGGKLKAILREIARRRVGPEVASRKKQGFLVPVERWLADRWRNLLDQLLGDTLLEQEGWIRGGALKDCVRAAIRDQRVPLQIWRLLVLENWLQRRAAQHAPAMEVQLGSWN
jgi:asparagine synthase (glutamine-hydrolysing)